MAITDLLRKMKDLEGEAGPIRDFMGYKFHDFAFRLVELQKKVSLV